MTMSKRRLGRTNLHISELTIGGGWVGGALIDQPDDVKRALVDRARAGGINWIDTAAAYGQGQSEAAIGRVLEDVPADRRPYVSTKVRLDPARDNDFAAQIRDSLAASLDRLKMSSVPLLQLHNPIAPAGYGDSVTPEQVLGDGGILDIFDGLRRAGLCAYSGVTALGDTAALKTVVASGRVDTAQVYFNILNPSAAHPPGPVWSGQDFDGLLATCAAHDVGVMGIRVFAAGVIASPTRHGREIPITDGSDLMSEARRAVAVFGLLGDGHGTRAQTGLRFALAEPGIASVVIGLAEPAHLEEALAGAAAGPLPAAARDQVRALYRRDYGF